MTDYFIRRILLMIPTFVGITFVCFAVTRYVPGGPVEQAVMRYRYGGAGGGGEAGGGGGRGDQAQVTAEMVEKLKVIYGFDKPFPVAYAAWLSRVVRLDLGESYTFSEPVWDVIKRRLPISISLGLIGFILAYSVCIPLGVWKAVQHGSAFDVTTSAVVFAGYAVPGWAAGVVLLHWFAGGSGWNVFPLGGIASDNFWDLSLPARAFDLVWHAVLPVGCYVIGSFASLTVLMKNTLMESLGQDYVRTACAKGLPEHRVVFVHALRNSLIPLATGLGHVLSLVLAGSFLIERVFNIHGMGLLGFEAIVSRDYPVVLGILVISSMLHMVGNILSDVLYCLVDPRIRFQ
jgi:microcin C transport system permease protein